MDPITSNALLDHLFARMVFHMVQALPPGRCLLIEIKELDDDLFCVEQLKCMIEHEETRLIKAHRAQDIGSPGQKGVISTAVQDEIADVLLKQEGLVVIVTKDWPYDHLHFLVDHFVQLFADGHIKVLKNRYGLVTTKPVPWENFQDFIRRIPT